MEHSFDRDYWDAHWQSTSGIPVGDLVAHPYLAVETAGLTPGTALEAGCGRGAEAIWLAAEGWDVTAVDVASAALDAARAQSNDVEWVQADLTEWEPAESFDLVSTHYAHPTIPQLDFYERLSRWVAPGGSLLVVGHLHHSHADHHDHEPPTEASATAAAITARLAEDTWRVETARELTRTVVTRSGEKQLHDVVVRATRLRPT